MPSIYGMSRDANDNLGDFGGSASYGAAAPAPKPTAQATGTGAEAPAGAPTTPPVQTGLGGTGPAGQTTGLINTAAFGGAVATSTGQTTNPANPATATQPNVSADQVANWYRSDLGRNPDQAGLNFWTGQLANGADPNQVYKAFQQAAQSNREDVRNVGTYQQAGTYNGPSADLGNTPVLQWGQNALGKNLSGADVAKYTGMLNANPTPDGANAAYQQFLKDNNQSQNGMSLADASQLGNPTPFTLPAVTAAQISPYNAVHATINPATDTVQGQVNGLLQKGNPLLDRAEALSDQRMNERGLVNSSLGVQAGQTAMLDTALQIATPDAGFYNQQRLTNQQYDNASAEFNANAQNTVNNMGYANALQQSNMALGNHFDLSKISAQGNVDLQKLQTEGGIDLSKISAQGQQQIANTLAQIQANAQVNNDATTYNAGINAIAAEAQYVNSINSNPQIDASTKPGLIAAAEANLESQLNYYNSIAGTNHGNLLNNTGNYAPQQANQTPALPSTNNNQGGGGGGGDGRGGD